MAAKADTAVFIDLDGTLTDPRPGIAGSIRYALERLGIAPVPTEDELLWCIGPPIHESFVKLLGTTDKAAIERAVALYRERYGDIGLFENEVYPGIPAMLAALAKDGRRLFVATSKLQVYAARIVEHFSLARHFETVFGAEADGTRSNKADLMRHAVGQTKVAPTTSVMLGDRVHDAMGAQAVGMPCLLAEWGYGAPEELKAAKNDGLCRTPADVPPAIARLLRKN
jgi:phosphoglycolate phosphatase